MNASWRRDHLLQQTRGLAPADALAKLRATGQEIKAQALAGCCACQQCTQQNQATKAILHGFAGAALAGYAIIQDSGDVAAVRKATTLVHGRARGERTVANAQAQAAEVARREREAQKVISQKAADILRQEEILSATTSVNTATTAVSKMAEDAQAIESERERLTADKARIESAAIEAAVAAEKVETIAAATTTPSAAATQPAVSAVDTPASATSPVPGVLKPLPDPTPPFVLTPVAEPGAFGTKQAGFSLSKVPWWAWILGGLGLAAVLSDDGART